jgi:hypothetical protein
VINEGACKQEREGAWYCEQVQRKSTAGMDIDCCYRTKTSLPFHLSVDLEYRMMSAER